VAVGAHVYTAPAWRVAAVTVPTPMDQTPDRPANPVPRMPGAQTNIVIPGHAAAAAVPDPVDHTPDRRANPAPRTPPIDQTPDRPTNPAANIAQTGAKPGPEMCIEDMIRVPAAEISREIGEYVSEDQGYPTVRDMVATMSLGAERWLETGPTILVKLLTQIVLHKQYEEN
jgi:hypothetical protein